MGLDMYLTAQKTLYRSSNDEANLYGRVKGIAEEMGLPGADNLDFVVVGREAGYWRKANQIHRWFVKECQGGVDECQETPVSHEKIVELNDLCVELLKTRDPIEAAQKLPPSSGFFFGGTELDDYYWRDLENTVEILKPLVADTDLSFVYRSSW